MSSAFNGSSALEHFECANTIDISNKIMFDFYLELPQSVLENVGVVYTTPQKWVYHLPVVSVYPIDV